jgi:hypothetical protein
MLDQAIPTQQTSLTPSMEIQEQLLLNFLEQIIPLKASLQEQRLVSLAILLITHLCYCYFNGIAYPHWIITNTPFCQLQHMVSLVVLFLT